MPYTEKTCFDANNSNIQTTPGGETANIQILFGLTPAEISYILGSYLVNHTSCSIAIMEMLREIQRLNNISEDTSILVSFTETVGVLVNIEHIEPHYVKFNNAFGLSKNPAWLEKAFNDPEKWQLTLNLHNAILEVMQQIDQVGYIDFSFDVIGAIQNVTTKIAYEDNTNTYSVTQNLYNSKTRTRCSLTAERRAGATHPREKL